MTAFQRPFRAVNRRSCRRLCMSDNVGLSDVLGTPRNSSNVAAFRSLDGVPRRRIFPQISLGSLDSGP
jgi:hypothetical protein